MKSPRKYFYQTFLSFCGKLTGKSSLFLIFVILWLFVKTLTPDDKYSLCNIWNLQELHQMLFCKKPKSCCQFFCAFFKSASNFQHFEKKHDFHSLYIFGITDWKTLLGECLDSPVSEHPSTDNMSKRLKHRWNLNHSNFMISFEPFWHKRPGKSLC